MIDYENHPEVIKAMERNPKRNLDIDEIAILKAIQKGERPIDQDGCLDVDLMFLCFYGFLVCFTNGTYSVTSKGVKAISEL